MAVDFVQLACRGRKWLSIFVSLLVEKEKNCRFLANWHGGTLKSFPLCSTATRRAKVTRSSGRNKTVDFVQLACREGKKPSISSNSSDGKEKSRRFRAT